jgi:hypothetical protein
LSLITGGVAGGTMRPPNSTASCCSDVMEMSFCFAEGNVSPEPGVPRSARPVVPLALFGSP